MKQSVINTMNRVGIYPDIQSLEKRTNKVTVFNRFGGGSCETTPVVQYLINWVYNTSNDYEMGVRNVTIADFDRIRYYVLEVDNNAYMTCLD